MYTVEAESEAMRLRSGCERTVLNRCTSCKTEFLDGKKNNNPLEADISSNQLTKVEYDSLVATSPVVLIDFGAKWCPPCKKMEPVLQQLQSDLSGKFVLHKIDGGIQTDIMRQLDIEELPTFIIYKEGKEVWRKTGLETLDGLKTNLQKHF